jgi:hypothetical protein
MSSGLGNVGQQVTMGSEQPMQHFAQRTAQIIERLDTLINSAQGNNNRLFGVLGEASQKNPGLPPTPAAPEGLIPLLRHNFYQIEEHLSRLETEIFKMREHL